MQIDGAVALVTGANRGLGHAFARVLVERGARTVYAGARRPETVTDPDVVPIRLDITDQGSIEAAAWQCRDVTLLVNNAAIARNVSFLDAPTLDPARDEMETNYFGTLSMCRAFAPILGGNGGGALVNMLSIVSFVNVPSLGSFCATKAAAWSLTNGVRIELRTQDTLVVAAHASFIDTDLSAGFDVPKHDPREVAGQVLDAVAAGREEILADEETSGIKAGLARDLELLYPEIEQQWLASRASAAQQPTR